MIARYTRKEMGKIWSDQNKFNSWLKTELAVLTALEKLNKISVKSLNVIKEQAGFTVQEIEEEEKKTNHDLNAFVRVVQSRLPPEIAGLFHSDIGLTSYDIEEPALCLMILESLGIIIKDVGVLNDAILKRADEHKNTLMAARTHGQIAEPTTFCLRLLNYYDSLDHLFLRLKQLSKVFKEAKISGAVGTYSSVAPQVEEMALAELKLKPAKIATQILSRDRISSLIGTLADLAGILEKISLDVWLGSRSEIGELMEPFGKLQTGSSRMAHKKNPIISERIRGLARIVRALDGAAKEDIATAEERDITQSSVERIILPGSFELVDYMLLKQTETIEGLQVFPERMRENLERFSQGNYASGPLRDFLSTKKGLNPDQAYRTVQSASSQATKENRHLREVMIPLIWGTEKPEPAELEEFNKCFDPWKFLEKREIIYARFAIKI